MTSGQIIASAFEKQLSPKGITGQIVVNVVILIFETVGYTIGGKKKFCNPLLVVTRWLIVKNAVLVIL